MDNKKNRIDGNRQSRRPHNAPNKGLELLNEIKTPRASLLGTNSGTIVWSPDGLKLAVVLETNTIGVWDALTGQFLGEFGDHPFRMTCIAFSPSGNELASAGMDDIIKIWNFHDGKLIRRIGGSWGNVEGLSWSPDGKWFAFGSVDGKLKVFSASTWASLPTENEPEYGVILSVDWSSDSKTLALASTQGQIVDAKTGQTSYGLPSLGGLYEVKWSPAADSTWIAGASSNHSVIIWHADTGREYRVLEGHTDDVRSVDFASDGSLLASSSDDGTVKLWDSDDWRELATLANRSEICFHPKLPILATLKNDRFDNPNLSIEIWEIDKEQLRSQLHTPSVTYTSAKIVLVGDSGVGKTGLGWRLAHGEFKEHSSTHGQQFWLLDQLSKLREDGTQCEAVLWDLAGQPDYRLIHALFLDDTDLALVLFDPTRDDDPLRGVEFWLKQFNISNLNPAATPIVLVSARTDRGTPRLTEDEIKSFCAQRGVKFYTPTSAKDGEGIHKLIGQMQSLIPWDEKSATVTTETFKRIKDIVLALKENPKRRRVVLTPKELRSQIVKGDRSQKFTDDEMLTAVGHLANHGYVTRLKTSAGEPRILLAPELLNNLAASFVLEARRNVKGLGALEEGRLFAGEYDFPELKKITQAEKDILVDSAAALFLEHNVSLRETDPLNGRVYFVFPELINLKKPSLGDENPTEDGVAYTVSGSTENVYASLVVLMGYTQTFTRTNQWRNQARYEVGEGHTCGFRQEEDSGELTFVLYFGVKTPASIRTLFQSLFENFLKRRNLSVKRLQPVLCSKEHVLNRVVIRGQASMGFDYAYCSQCGEKIDLSMNNEPIRLSELQSEEVEAGRKAANLRSRFERILLRLKTYVTEQKITVPVCFVSYAWGVSEHERWVEKSLATDLQKAGLTVVLDKWDNDRIGASVPRFIERAAESDRIIVVGTELYRKKYGNDDISRPYIVAAEGDLINKRMIGTEEQKESVMPVLLEGTEGSAFPNLLQGRVHADFRKTEQYFDSSLSLLLSLYGIASTDSIAGELYESLHSIMGQ